MNTKSELKTGKIGGNHHLKNKSIKIWGAWRGFIFVWTDDGNFWAELKRLTHFKKFSFYFYPDGKRAWQCIFPKRKEGQINRKWQRHLRLMKKHTE